MTSRMFIVSSLFFHDVVMLSNAFQVLWFLIFFFLIFFSFMLLRLTVYVYKVVGLFSPTYPTLIPPEISHPSSDPYIPCHVGVSQGSLSSQLWWGGLGGNGAHNSPLPPSPFLFISPSSSYSQSYSYSSSASETDFPEGRGGRLRWWICTAEACLSNSAAWNTWPAPVQSSYREGHNYEL